MIPGMGGMNPKKMQAIMKQMGIKQEEIEAARVIIEKEDGNIIIEEPQVTKINMQGAETWQIAGEAREETSEDTNAAREEDIKLIVEKTGKTEEEARKALEETNDIAEAIINLS